MGADVRSPRIEHLTRQLAAGGGKAAVDAFWRRVEAEGAPIIEPIDGDPDRVCVTLVYRADASASVAMQGSIAGQNIPRLNFIDGTDVWWLSCAVPLGARTSYGFFAPAPFEGDFFDLTDAQLKALPPPAMLLDPLNPHAFRAGSHAQPQSVIELPGAAPQPWHVRREGVPEGRLAFHRLQSVTLGGERLVWTYEPPAYDSAAPLYPVLVLFDGYAYAHMDLRHTLDNLIAERRIPPMVCALYQPADRITELACDESVAGFAARELTREWLPSLFNITADPSRSIIGGMSLGGLGALFNALRHPSVFGNVISQSGSFWWGPGAPIPGRVDDPSIEWEWLTKQMARTEMPIRVYMEVGALERTPRPGVMADMIEPNRRMRDALTAAGHEVVRYDEFNGGHDMICWRGTIADALIAIAGPWMR